MPDNIINTGNMWADVSDVARLHLDTRRAIHDGLWREISHMAERLHTSSDAVIDRLIAEVQEMCGLEQRAKEEIRRYIDAEVSRTVSLLDTCQGLIDENNRKIAKREANRQAQARRRSNQRLPAEGVTGPTTSLYPPPPTRDSLAGKYLRIGSDGDTLALDQFTDDMWANTSDTGIFWSTGPTPFTRASVAYYEERGDDVQPAGELWLNTTIDLPDEDATQVITDLGFRPADVQIATQEDAYYAAAQHWGQVVVDNLYDQRGMRTYARRPNDVPRLRDANPAELQPALFSNVRTEPILGQQPVQQPPQAVNVATTLLQPEQQPGESTEHWRERIISTVELLISKGLVRPEDRAAVEQQWLQPGRPEQPQVAGQPESRQILPPHRSVVPHGTAQMECGLSMADLLLSAMGFPRQGCEVDFCKLVNRLCRFFGIPENRLPPCVSVQDMLRSDPTNP